MAKSALHEAPVTTRKTETVLSLVDVSKTFGAVKAVDRVSIDVNEGEVLTPARAQRLRQDHHPADGSGLER